MGKKDITLKDYLSDVRRYADLWNGCVFQGQQILKPEAFTAINTVMGKADEQAALERTSDITMKQTSDGSFYTVWIVENQFYVDYSMPVRIMMQEALAYDKQVKEIKKKNKIIEKNNSTKKSSNTCIQPDEFLSKVRKDDYLNPVTTLVVYWGDETWQGAKSLHDLINFGEDNILAEKLKKFIPEYPLHFIDLSNLDHYEYFHTELKTLLELYSRRQDKHSFLEYLENHDECKNMDNETFRVLGTLTHSKELKNYRPQNQTEDFDMCRAITELIEDGKKEGIKEGKETGLLEGLNQGKEEGLRALTETLKGLLHDFDTVYETIIQNNSYHNITKEQVRKYY